MILLTVGQNFSALWQTECCAEVNFSHFQKSVSKCLPREVALVFSSQNGPNMTFQKVLVTLGNLQVTS